MRFARRVIGWPVAWALYGIGHLAFLVIDRWLPDSNDEPGAAFNAGFRIYQGAMAWSVRVNDWAGLDIWETPSP